MNVLIIGSGLIGVTTAYFLKRRGYDVTVIDRETGPGREASFANAALLTPSMSYPWNAPGSWRTLLSSLGRSDSALQLHLRTLPALASWGLTFFQNSRTGTFEQNTLTNFRLAQYSLDVMSLLRQQTNITYDRVARGTLRIYRDRTALEQARAAANPMLSNGLRFRALSAEEVVELEPSLAPIAKELKGAIHFEADETGDAYQFCRTLAKLAEQEGVQFHFRTSISSLERRGERVVAAISDRKRFVADQYVVAAGSYSTPILQSAGVHLPVRPVKGYSVTFERPFGATLPHIPIADDQLHTVIVPLEGVIRVAGTAEFAGYDLTLPTARIRNLLTLLQEVLPQTSFDFTTAKPWCGLRAMSADSVPIIGPTPLTNVLVNTGHGHLGWTMAAGSAQLLTDIMSGNPPSINSSPFALARFSRSQPSSRNPERR